MKKQVSIFLLFVIVLSSCLDEVKLQLRQETEKLIVEGNVSNEIEGTYLRLSLTTQYGYAEDIKPARGVYVEIRDSKNQVFSFRPDPNTTGVYLPDKQDFKGEIGESYSIYLKLQDGREFSSKPEKILAPVAIKTLSAKFRKTNQYGYEVFLDTQDPKDAENYYRWETSGYYVRRSVGIPTGPGDGKAWNRCYLYAKDRSIRIYSDANTNGSLLASQPIYFSPYYTVGKHLIEAKQYTISRSSYAFWRKYQQQQIRTGTIFDPLPATLLGNVVNIKDKNDIAIGYFETAAVSKKRMIIPDTLTKYDYFFNNEIYVPGGDCMNAFPSAIYSDRLPKGWQ
jgi:Domain of unknown function (DUF4249)